MSAARPIDPLPSRPYFEAWLVATENPACLAWARFASAPGPAGTDDVEVLALTGAASYIERRMPRDEARAEYRALVAAGWLPRSAEQARASGMSAAVLRALVHD